MRLTFNDEHQRYEFHCDRNERDIKGRLGLVLASNARLQTKWQHGASIHGTPFFITTDPHKAQQVAEIKHTDGSPVCEPDVLALIQQHVTTNGSGVPVMTHRKGCYIWRGPQSGNGITYFLIPKLAGFAFTRTPFMTLPHEAGAGMDEPVWWTQNSDKAAQCLKYADELARQAVENFRARKNAALQASRAGDSDIEIPVPEGLTPFGYQKAGVAYFLPRKRVLLGDEMGLGKTIQAALWINMVPEIKKVLIVCPASLKRNWQRELEKWLVRPTTIGIAATDYKQVIPSSDIVIINYDILARKVDTGRKKLVNLKERKVFDYFLREKLKQKWDLIVVDECHRCKGDPATVIRSRMVYALEGERVLFMSGTPMVNRPRELWFILHYLAPKVFANKTSFMKTYCAGDSFHDPFGGAKNLADLQNKLRAYLMVRRLKKDVLKDLPPKMRQVIELPAAGCESVVQSEMLAFTRKEDVLTTMRLRVELAKASENPQDYKHAVAKLTEGIRVAFEDLSRIRRETAIAKIPVVTEHVASILSEGHKVILFCHHKEVVKQIAESFKKEVVIFTGDTSLTARDQAVQDFQTKDNIRLFIGTIGAAGVGLTLTASSYVVFAELDWVPGNVTQAEDRAHRIGQQDNVLVQHLVLEGSLDKRMADVLVEKQDIAERAMDRESADEILDEPILPERERMATMGTSRKDIDKLVAKITQLDIDAVHYGLRVLAGTHKDAKLLDGLTFRAVDAPLGKILADAKKLTPRMAALGKKFLSRYRNTALAAMPEIKQLFTKETK